MKEFFTNKNIQKRLWFTLIAFAVYRFGCAITIPGVNQGAVTEGLESMGLFDMISMIGGGGLAQFSIFALGVTPYITASIVIQLLAIGEVIPKLAQLQKEGTQGRRKLDNYTKYLSVVLAILQAVTTIYALNNQASGVFIGGITLPKVIFATTVLVAGVVWLSWLADRITQKGLGNGMSMIIMAGIVGRLPNQLIDAQTTLGWTGKFALYLLCMFVILAGITLLNTTERRIPVQYTSSSAELTKANAKTSYLPFKVNSASVLPVIFASSVMMAPLQIIAFLPQAEGTNLLNNLLGMKTWYSIVIYALLTWFFCFFYTHVQLDDEQIAENLDLSGAYIPNVSPGKDTQTYLHNSISRVTVLGAIGLTLIAVLPHIMPLIWTDMPSSMALGGTGLIIVVGVAIETTKQIRGMMTQNSYKRYYRVAGLNE